MNVLDKATVIAQRFGYILIAGEKPHAGRTIGADTAEHGCMLVQPRIRRIRIGLELRPRKKCAEPPGKAHSFLELRAHDRWCSGSRAAGGGFWRDAHTVEIFQRLCWMEDLGATACLVDGEETAACRLRAQEPELVGLTLLQRREALGRQDRHFFRSSQATWATALLPGCTACIV